MGLQMGLHMDAGLREEGRLADKFGKAGYTVDNRDALGRTGHERADDVPELTEAGTRAEKYLPRLIDARIDRLMREATAVEIVGTCPRCIGRRLRDRREGEGPGWRRPHARDHGYRAACPDELHRGVCSCARGGALCPGALRNGDDRRAHPDGVTWYPGN